ncbi:hypothetical protein AB0L82_31235 [Nocardia sp. NPDC052001]|uniref:hypothetical protein n=1 Tax=Nocardia sp. NPDC052001 TaxID=3154853 RepID=UPI003423E7CD
MISPVFRARHSSAVRYPHRYAAITWPRPHLTFTLAREAGRMLLSEPEIFTRERLLAFARTTVADHLANSSTREK